jgi:uncharacterized membrane protein YdjX (TVP38/TMEM64 family)
MARSLGLERAFVAVLALQALSCAARIPTPEELDGAILALRRYDAWAWALGIGAICADLVLPVPQTAVIAALGILYGLFGGALLGSAGLLAAGLLGYGLARRYGRRLVVRLAGDRSLERVEGLFARADVWAIVLTRSLPYSLAEIVVLVAGLSGMGVGRFTLALCLGSLPTAFVFAAIGAGWEGEPLLALAVAYLAPIPLVPPVLYLLRGRGGEPPGAPPSPGR